MRSPQALRASEAVNAVFGSCVVSEGPAKAAPPSSLPLSVAP
jgi:hypothetical protein